MKIRGQLVPAILLGVALIAALWWYFWFAPARASNAALATQIRADGDRIVALQAELIRLRAVDTAVPLLSAAEAVDRWNDVVRAVEASGLTVAQITLAPPAPVATPAPQPAADADAAQPEQPASPVVQMHVGMSFSGDYTKVRTALAAATAAVEGTAWTGLELSGQADGAVTAKGEVDILALVVVGNR